MQVIGLCRFSYPAEGGFQVEHGSIQDRIDYLYAPDRIEERFQHFETICLPGLKAQTDSDFTFLILIGDSLPEMHLSRLHSLIADFPQAQIISRAPGPHRTVCQEVINDARDMALPCLQFRHDDDDAVAIDFIAKARDAAAACEGLYSDARSVLFDWHKGFVARPDARGICAEESFTPYWGLAQAMLALPGYRKSVMNFGHNKMNRFMPTVTFPDDAMFVRGHNDHNDSRQKAHVKQVALPRLDAEGEELFKSRFAIDADHVRSVFS